MTNAITAKEAHDRTHEIVMNTLQEHLNSVYEKINVAINAGLYRVYYIAPDIEIGNFIFNKLVADDYYVEMSATSPDPDDYAMELNIGWEDSSYDMDKRYILLMDDTRNAFGQVCTILHHGQTSDSWTFQYVNNMSEAINFGYTVTAKDIEEAPDWVKAIEPIEVKE